MKHKVYIIESPGAADFLEERTEGVALAAALKLSAIENRHFSVVSREMLMKSLDLIGAEIRDRQETFLAEVMEGNASYEDGQSVCLHFSCHGNQSGIGLTDNDFIGWEELGDILINFGKNADIFFADGGYNHLTLTLSVCEGNSAKKMFDKSKNGCHVLVGPDKKVSWADSLVAFTTFYHLLIFKQMLGREAVDRMNIAAGLDGVFRFAVAPGFL